MRKCRSGSNIININIYRDARKTQPGVYEVKDNIARKIIRLQTPVEVLAKEYIEKERKWKS